MNYVHPHVQETRADGVSVEGIMLFPLVLLVKALGTGRRSYYSRKMGVEFSDPLAVLMGKKYILVVSQKR